MRSPFGGAAQAQDNKKDGGVAVWGEERREPGVHRGSAPGASLSRPHSPSTRGRVPPWTRGHVPRSARCRASGLVQRQVREVPRGGPGRRRSRVPFGRSARPGPRGGAPPAQSRQGAGVPPALPRAGGAWLSLPAARTRAPRPLPSPQAPGGRARRPVAPRERVACAGAQALLTRARHLPGCPRPFALVRGGVLERLPVPGWRQLGRCPRVQPPPGLGPARAFPAPGVSETQPRLPASAAPPSTGNLPHHMSRSRSQILGAAGHCPARLTPHFLGDAPPSTCVRA